MNVETIVDRLFEISEAAGYEYERPSWRFYAGLLRDDPDEIGLAVVSMLLGPMNWGTNWVAWGESDLVCLEPPADPAGFDWAGTSKRSGKHLLDGGRDGYRSKTGRPMGGPGPLHSDGSGDVDDDLDDGNLERIYGRWGEPAGIPYKHLSKTFDQLVDYKSGKYRKAWLDYITPLLASREFHVWIIVDVWIKRYFGPAREAHPDDPAAAALNARIRNSASGVGKRLAGKSIEDQIVGYAEYKGRRSERAATRAVKQAKYALRVGPIVETLTIQPVD